MPYPCNRTLHRTFDHELKRSVVKIFKYVPDTRMPFRMSVAQAFKQVYWM